MLLLFDYLAISQLLRSVLRSCCSGMLPKSLIKTWEEVQYLIELQAAGLIPKIRSFGEKALPNTICCFLIDYLKWNLKMKCRQRFASPKSSIKYSSQ